MTPFARSFGLGLLLAGVAVAGWQPIDSITKRDTSDLTCQSNARSVVSDAAGNIHVVWRGRVDGVWQPWYSCRDASTGGWSPDAVLDTVLGGIYDPACILGPDQSLYVGWNDSVSGTLHLMKRDMAGRWTELASLAGQPGDSMVSLCADGSGSIHAVWRGSDIGGSCVCYSSHTDTGWSRPETLTAGTYGSWPSIACSSGDTAMAVWVGSSGYSIVSRRRVSGSWLGPEVVYDGRAVNPCVAWSGDGFHLVWLAGNSPAQHLLVRSRSDSGWSDTTRLSAGRVGQPGVSIAAEADGALHVAWVGGDSSGPESTHVQYRTRLSEGAWQRQMKLTAGSVNPQRVSMAAGGGRVQVAWSDQQPLPRGLAVRLRRYERVHDVGVPRIERPTGVLDSGAVVQPAAWVKNYGDFPESGVPVWLRFAGYENRKLTGSLAPGDSAPVAFDSETLVVRGPNVVTCSTALASDNNPANDTVRGTFFVRVLDVAAIRIESPPATVDSGDAVVPEAWVRNLGTGTVSFPVTFRIGSGYADTKTVAPLNPADSTLVSFASWTPGRRGTFGMRCSTGLTGDRIPANDTAEGTVTVRVRDVGTVCIALPTEAQDSGAAVVPACSVYNYGDESETYKVRLRIGPYEDSATVSDHAAGTIRLVTFADWTAPARGWQSVRCSTMLGPDRNPGNNTRSCSVFVRVCDAAPVRILCPVETISRGQVRPRVKLANRGNETESIPARFEVFSDTGRVYLETITVAVGPSDSAVAEFPPWRAQSGTYTGVCSTALAGDMRSDNDSVSATVYVESLENRRWRECAPVSRGPWGRPVRDGGCLVAVANGLLAFKGANTCEWYRYSAAADSWAALAGIPPGVDGHKVRAGAAVCWDGNSAVFALKGTGTHEFWRYDIAGDSWHALASLPENTKGARYGSGVVFVPVKDTGKVFMVKGSSTRDFLVYWVRQNEWHARRPLPPGLDSAPARHGTCLALLGGRIFCLKGGKNEFYEYFPVGDSWFKRADLPRLGRGWQWKKTAKGAALASDGSRFLYAFKGGRCNEFWRYDSRGDSWSQLDDVPTGNYRRKVGDGGALAWFGSQVYGLKGGGSSELWRFDPLAVPAVVPEPGRGAAAYFVPLPVARHAPALLRCGRVAGYPVPNGTTAVVIIDAAGRVVAQRAAVPPLVELRFSRAGVYFVLTTGDCGSVAAKTVVVP